MAGDMRQVGGLAGRVRRVAFGVLASHICSEGMLATNNTCHHCAHIPLYVTLLSSEKYVEGRRKGRELLSTHRPTM